MNINIQNNTNIDTTSDDKKVNLVNNITDVISYAFYPCTIKISNT